MIEFGRQIVQGAATGLAIDRVKQTAKVIGPDEPNPVLEQLKLHTLYLKEIAEALSPQASPDVRFNITIYPYPNAYRLPQYTQNHFCLFVPSSTIVRFDIPGVGVFTKTLEPGWVLCDLDGGTELSSGDASSHNLVVCFCEGGKGDVL